MYFIAPAAGERFSWVLWHINNCRLFNTESLFLIYIKYISKTHFIDTFLNNPELILLYIVKWFQVFLSRPNISIHYKSFVCTQMVSSIAM